jgi:hypothetical protein
MRCGKCGYVNRQESRVCNLCGALLIDKKVSRKKQVINDFSRKPLIKVKRCVRYGHVNKGSDIFCHQCGSELVPVEDDTKAQITASIANHTEKRYSGAMLTAVIMIAGFIGGTLFGALLL